MKEVRFPVLLITFILLSQLCFTAINNSDSASDELKSKFDANNSIQYTDNHTIVEIGPSSRKAILELPGGHNISHKLPLVVALHGFTNSGSFVSSYFDLIDSIHENGHLLLRPDGSYSATGQRYWNATDACCNIWNEDVDDVSWLTVLINEAITYHGADPEGVILVGHSNGGFMAHRMACERGYMIRAAISLAGATYSDFDDCSNTGYPNILQIHGALDSVIQYDGGTLFGNTYPSAPQTVNFWANRSGCDNSLTLIDELDIISPSGENDTIEFEYLNCNLGNRVSLWKIPDGGHLPAVSSASDDDFAETILNWGLSGYFPDSDADGVRDDEDAFPHDPSETLDSDGDGVGDNSDVFPYDPSETLDSDGDGVGDNSDAFPLDPQETLDSDEDGVGDNSDAFPNNPSETLDSDGDGVGDNSDLFPFDVSESSDTDMDGVGDNSDAFPLDPQETLDSDGDGVGDNSDVFPLDPSETLDSDGDGVGDNSDAFPLDPQETLDSDGDGVGDNSDEFPQDPSETLDSDGDGVGDNSDEFPQDPSETLDSDGDGVGDNSDAFPLDPQETLDSDGDGVGDNSDAFPNDFLENMDSDGDGVGDNFDVFPYDQNESIDFDNDGVGDNSDAFPNDSDETLDSDGDGVGDNSDIFPNDANETLDSDGDGVGDNSDLFPGDPERWEINSDISLIDIQAIVIILVFVLLLFFLSPSKTQSSRNLLNKDEIDN
jgi:poly(3-hydroxybutyrate) depolymerase